MLRFTEFRIAVPSVLACCGLVATGPASAQTLPERTLSSDAARSVLANAPAALKTISAADLESFAKTLASDAFGGRLTGTPGQVKAAQLFASQFEKLGLQPLGDANEKDERGWFQAYDVRFERLVSDATGLFDTQGTKLNHHGAWFVPGRKPRQYGTEGQLVFSHSKRTRDLDLTDKIAVIPFKIRPDRPGGNVYRAMSIGMNLLAVVRSHANRARRAGAAGCVLVSPEFTGSFLSATNMFGVFPGKPRVTRTSRGARAMMLGGAGTSIPTLVVTGNDANKVFAALGLTAEEAFDPSSDDTHGRTSKLTYKLTAKRVIEPGQAVNTCGFLEGTDPDLKKQAIVYSCHMDHLGHAADGGFFYGADDNASGSSSVLEIAEAYAGLAAGERPKRSVIFLAVSGEELGLWGSDHFVNHPTWDLDRIVANINMDMLGRSTRKVPADCISVTPSYRHRNYSTLARDAAFLGRALGLEMKNGDRFYTRSDHYNFAKKGIPVVFFADDEHEDYHMPTDTWDKLEYPKMERIARLAFLVGLRAANANKAPQSLGRRAGWFAEAK